MIVEETSWYKGVVGGFRVCSPRELQGLAGVAINTVLYFLFKVQVLNMYYGLC